MKRIFILIPFLALSCFSFSQTTLVSLGSSWKYNDTGTDPGASWKDPEFNDTAWANGNALLGYGTINAESVVTTISYGPDANNKYPTYYFRKTFNYTLIGGESALEIDALIDDGAVFYINGVEVKRLNMPAGIITYSTWAPANGNEDSYQQFFISASVLQSGTNTIAVEVHQFTATSTDAGMNMKMIVHYVPFERGGTWKYNDTGTDLGTVWTAPAYIDTAWASGNALLGYGGINAEATVTTISYGSNSSNKFPCYYFRKNFTYTFSGNETYFEVNALIDDGAVFYINGVEIKRLNMPSGIITYNTWASGNGNEDSYQQFFIPTSYIQNGSNTIAVEVHQYTATSSDVGFNMDLIARTSPVTSITQIHFGSTNLPLDGATITWRNPGTADSIKWGYSSSYLDQKSAGAIRSNYTDYLYDFAFPLLHPDIDIYYSMWDSYFQCWTPNKIFHTPKQQDADHFTFTAMGDSRTNWDDWQAISSAVRPSDFVLFLGDLVTAGGTAGDWDNWFTHGTDFFGNNIVYYTIGNHDLSGDTNAVNYRNIMVMPPNPGNELYYSFVIGNAVFICLNSSDAGDTTQYNWLISTLDSNKDKKWRFVFFHKPFFTSPNHVGEMNAYFTTWWKAFDDYGVEVIFNGHTHNYQRSVPINRNISDSSAVAAYGHCPLNGRCQIIAGAAGAPGNGIGTGWFEATSVDTMNYVNIKVSGDTLHFMTYDRNNAVIDSFIMVRTFDLRIEATATDLCQGDSLRLNGSGAQYYSWSDGINNGETFVPAQTNVYTLIGSNADQCADSLSQEIFVLPRYHFTESHEICSGETYNWQGNSYNATGTYHADYLTGKGCDSTYTFNLTVNPKYSFTQNHEICSGETYNWQGNSYNTTGTYHADYLTGKGCDSTYTFNLTVNPKYSFTQNHEICSGETYNWQGNSYNATGTYHADYLTGKGCDSIYTLNLTVNPKYSFTQNHEICSGETYNWQGNSYNATGTYHADYLTGKGCDSTYTMNLTVNPKYSFTQNHEICSGETYNWQGNSYNATGTYHADYLTGKGCDSTYTMNLTVNPKYSFTQNHEICSGETYNWQGNSYNATGTYHADYLTGKGCDSTYTFNLTVNPKYSFTQNHEICSGETYNWQGNSYNATGTYHADYLTGKGCDSIYTLNLTVNPKYSFTQNHEICSGETYNWQGNSYNATGTYHADYLTGKGCDSIYTLNLTVNPKYSFTQNHEICSGETYNWQGNSYNANGTYYANYLTNKGCDSIYQLVLTVHSSPLQFNITGPIAVIENQTQEYSVPPNAGLIYTWIVVNGSISNQVTNDTTQIQWGSAGTGQINVIAEDPFGCTADTVSLEITIGTTGQRDNTEPEKIVVYPNPSYGSFVVILPISSSRLSVIDAYGQTVRKIESGFSEGRIRLIIPSGGMYFVVITSGTQTYTQKLIINK